MLQEYGQTFAANDFQVFLGYLNMFFKEVELRIVQFLVIQVQVYLLLLEYLLVLLVMVVPSFCLLLFTS